MRRRIGEGSRALVTGCSSGIGLAVTRLLLDRGLEVVGLSRRPSDIDHPHFRWVKGDLAQASLETVLDAIEDGGAAFDLIVNNAGSGEVAAIAELTPEQIERSLRLLLLAPILITRHFLSAGRPVPAAIVNVSSLAAELPIPLMPVYNCAKAGLSQFTRSLILDGHAYPETRFIDFRPGDYRTPFTEAFRAGTADPRRGAYLQRLLQHHERAPAPEKAAEDLWRVLLGNREGVVRSGMWFQARWAPAGARFLPGRQLLALIRRYYGLKR
jgi:uncharacterized protein